MNEVVRGFNEEKKAYTILNRGVPISLSLTEDEYDECVGIIRTNCIYLMGMIAGTCLAVKERGVDYIVDSNRFRGVDNPETEPFKILEQHNVTLHNGVIINITYPTELDPTADMGDILYITGNIFNQIKSVMSSNEINTTDCLALFGIEIVEGTDTEAVTSSKVTDECFQVNGQTFDMEFVEDVMSSVLEGGSNYWIDSIDYEEPDGVNVEYASEVITHGGTIIIKPLEDGTVYRFNLESFIEGFKMYLDKNGHGLIPQTDAGYIDADHADVIFQLGLFGQVIYG